MLLTNFSYVKLILPIFLIDLFTFTKSNIISFLLILASFSVVLIKNTYLSSCSFKASVFFFTLQWIVRASSSAAPHHHLIR
ncbi:hypothetical protein RIF29_41952 [Crotalaria pallida]|uniref:Uncharacterized protein n=1 Tax=Crotalaria pallida TaxID=3830 RepID=A0AAN9E7A9_CROPI